jgi:hypothetical protein
MDRAAIADLEARLLDILSRYPGGLKEFDLLSKLRDEQGGSSGESLFRDSLDLYRAHFLLFHALYRLQDHLTARRQGMLEIHVLNIRLIDYQATDTTLPARDDPIRSYYLDWRNLEDTTLEDVEALLGDFWVRYFAGENRDGALAELGLETNASIEAAERRYRELAMQRHPDRGGNAADFQRLQQAIEVLRRSAG